MEPDWKGLIVNERKVRDSIDAIRTRKNQNIAQLRYLETKNAIKANLIEYLVKSDNGLSAYRWKHRKQ